MVKVGIIERTKEIEKSKWIYKVKQEEFSNATTDLIRVQKDFGVIQNEHDLLKKQRKTLRDENASMITFQRIRTITCNRCYRDIIIKFSDQIIEILYRKGKSELIPSVLEIKDVEIDHITRDACQCMIY